MNITYLDCNEIPYEEVAMPNPDEIKSPYLQGYSDALDGRINLIAYDQHADYHSGYNQALQDTQQLEKLNDTAF